MLNKKRIEPIKMDNLLFTDARLFDPSCNLDLTGDLVIQKGKIEKIGKFQGKEFRGKILDCSGLVILPGLMDMHVHLREPGREDEETIESGCQAAMAGGFTAVCCMPNTEPPIDNRGIVELIQDRSEGLMVDVYPIGCITQGRKGEVLTEMGELVEAGVVGFSDDGYPIENSGVFRRALEYVSMFNVPIIEHSEDCSLSEDGVMNEGVVSTVLGLKGIPPPSEEIAVARNLLLAEYTKSPLHIAHVSTGGSVRMIREAKARGVGVTAETCPHYLVLTDEAVRSFDTNTKMKPPLRTEEDRKALIEGLIDGTIDVIATDHAPHVIHEKDTDYNAAAFGIVGLETAVGLIMTHLVDKNHLSLSQLVERMSLKPRSILHLEINAIKENNHAELTIINPDKIWQVDKSKFRSKSRNTPYHGWELKGCVEGVYNHGSLYWASS